MLRGTQMGDTAVDELYPLGWNTVKDRSNRRAAVAHCRCEAAHSNVVTRLALSGLRSLLAARSADIANG
jgi:hypothetical protein